MAVCFILLRVITAIFRVSCSRNIYMLRVIFDSFKEYLYTVDQTDCLMAAKQNCSWAFHRLIMSDWWFCNT